MAECDEIVTGLYLGNYNAACDKNLLDSLGITHILTVASDLKPQFLDSFTYKRIRALDMPSENLYGSFQEAIEFITQGLSQGHVLVHCLYGISRSSTIVVAYLMQTMNIKLDEALEITTSKRPCADPNSGFARQLRKFESDLVFYI
jgi:protein-tyrosine phosphatase